MLLLTYRQELSGAVAWRDSAAATFYLCGRLLFLFVQAADVVPAVSTAPRRAPPAPAPAASSKQQAASTAPSRTLGSLSSAWKLPGPDTTQPKAQAKPSRRVARCIFVITTRLEQSTQYYLASLLLASPTSSLPAIQAQRRISTHPLHSKVALRITHKHTAAALPTTII